VQDRFKAAKSISSLDFQPKDGNNDHERQMQLNKFQVWIGCACGAASGVIN